MPIDQALASMLDGTGIGYRRTPDGVYVLFARASPAALRQDEEPVPEILVIGRRTQNADIRRTQNDIQPYRVSTRRDIESAHRDNIDQYMRVREPSNADLVAPAQNTYVETASARSQIDLRGLGAARTLVLVDGRRMPSLPTPSTDYNQPDLNGIPLSAIDRIETLTGTAGGIYGPGAVGGVVNVVLRRDYRGFDLHLVSGVTSRGDAARLRLEGRLGFTPDGGRTDVMILAARSIADPLLTGDRDYMLRARRLRYANDPAAFIARRDAANSVGVLSTSGNLTFDEAHGGTALNASYTFLPLNFAGSPAERLALLVANAGRVDLSIPEDESGARRYLTTDATVTSAVLNVRRHFGSRIEAFVDFIYYRNNGRMGANGGSAVQITGSDAPTNPFSQGVRFTYPEPNLTAVLRQDLEMRRLTAGLIAQLPAGWRATADYAVGRGVATFNLRSLMTSPAYGDAIRRGVLGPDGLPLVDPLGDWAQFVSASAGFLFEEKQDARLVNHFEDMSLRLAGPLMPLPGGPLTLTLLAERRREHVPNTVIHFESFLFTQDLDIPDRDQRVRSAYAELRAPLIHQDHGPFPLRGLELQLAARYDAIRTSFPIESQVGFPSNGRLSVGHAGVTYTAGARFFPTPAIMLRGSVATGQLPPTIAQLSTSDFSVGGVDLFGAPDPLRGNIPVGVEGRVDVLTGGRSSIRPEHARTISIGAVLNPFGRYSPRIAIDYSRIDKRREISPFVAGIRGLVANADIYPGRITRAPLTDADRQAGFTGGRITQLDLRAANAGTTRLDAIDLQLDWRRPIGGAREIRLYGSGTWQLRFKSRQTPRDPTVSRIGHVDGPLRLRGNAGFDYTDGPLMVGLNVQYYSGYQPTYSAPARASLNPQILRYQGGARIPAQIYLDLSASRSFQLGDHLIDLSLGVLNVLDRSPPIIAQPDTPGYSFYADPRRRRFELSLSSRF